MKILEKNKKLWDTILINILIVKLYNSVYYNCFFCLADREKLIYWYITRRTNILNSSKTIKLLHIASKKNFREYLNLFHILNILVGI